MKTWLKKFLLKKNLYYPARYSHLFTIYQRLFKPAEIKKQQDEIAFYQSFLPSCKLIFDIGANDGHKTEAFLAIAEKVICCEPDTTNFHLLQVRFRNKKNRVMLENSAVADKEGISELYIHHPGSAFNTLSSKWKNILQEDNMQKWNEQVKFTQTQTVTTTTLDRLVEQYGKPDFIKIDAEGYEQWILQGLSHRVPFLSFETLLPEYGDELNACFALVEKLDNRATFNISLHDKLILPGFVSKMGMMNWLKTNTTITSFEIIVKMSA